MMKNRFFLLSMCILLFAALKAQTYAVDDKNSVLPVIVTWRNGHGYTEDGLQLKNTWAYDSKNRAGKYVLFGKGGEVMLKSEQLGGTETVTQAYTMTETKNGGLALRADVFKGFSGVLKITLKQEYAEPVSYELNEENQYGHTLKLASGSYEIVGAEAFDGKSYFKVNYKKRPIQIKVEQCNLLKFQVRNNVLGIIESEAAEQINTVAQPDSKKRDQMQGKKKDSMTVSESYERQSELLGHEKSSTEEIKKDFGMETIWMGCFGTLLIMVSGILLIKRGRSRYE